MVLPVLAMPGKTNRYLILLLLRKPMTRMASCCDHIRFAFPKPLRSLWFVLGAQFCHTPAYLSFLKIWVWFNSFDTKVYRSRKKVKKNGKTKIFSGKKRFSSWSSIRTFLGMLNNLLIAMFLMNFEAELNLWLFLANPWENMQHEYN